MTSKPAYCIAPSLWNCGHFLLASDDRFRFLGPAEENEEGEEVRSVNAGLTTAFQKARLLWTRELRDGWRSETALIIGPEGQTFQFGGGGEAYEKNVGAAFRQELYRGVPDGKRLGWRVGVDFLGGRESFLYDVPVGPTQLGDEAEAPEQGDSLYFAPAMYVEPTLRFGSVDLTLGARIDGWGIRRRNHGLFSRPSLGHEMDRWVQHYTQGELW